MAIWSTSAFPRSFILLQQEGHLISSSLCVGLTALRRSHVHNKGEVYSALFNLSIGLERFMKAIVIMHHMLTNDLAVPSRQDLKRYGHGLVELYATCGEIAREYPEVDVPSIDMLEQPSSEILSLLDDFAKTTRYHNLDSLSGASPTKDPLAHFDEVMSMILATDVPKRTVKRAVAFGGRVGSAIEDITTVMMQGLDGSDLTVHDAMIQPLLHEQATRHAVLRIVRLLVPLRGLIWELSHAVYGLGVDEPPFPQMQEFLDWLWDDRSYVLSKKRWP